MAGISALSPSRPFLLCSSLLILTLSACKGPDKEAHYPPPQVSVQTVAPKTVSVPDQFNGRIEAVDSVELRPRVSGYLQRIAFKEGDLVRKGDLLFLIDPRPFKIALDQAQARQRQAQAAAQLAQVQLKRVQVLVQARATSQEELDNALARQRQNQATLQAAQSAVDDAVLQLSFTEIRAPIAGRIGRAAITVGNLAQADQTLLSTLVSQDPVYVYFDRDEHSFLRDQAASAEGSTVNIGLAGNQGFPYAGTVDFLDNRLDAGTGTIRSRARLPNPDGLLRPGMYARVLFRGAAPHSAILVDDKAVLTDQDRKYVYIVDAQSKAQRREVVIGRAVNGERIIESGLNPGDAVVVEGFQKIFFPGAPVQAQAFARASK